MPVLTFDRIYTHRTSSARNRFWSISKLLFAAWIPTPFRTGKANVRRRRNDYDRRVFTQRPLFGALLFDNGDSDARDHCMAERSKAARNPLSLPQQVLRRC